MSLEVLPMNTPPLARPLPPSRSKRHSFSPSPNFQNGLTQLGEAPESSSLADRSREGMMGGLRERSEDELKRAQRGALEDALREEWEARDRLVMEVERLAASQRTLHERYDEAVKAVVALQTRSDEAFTEQGRLEADLQARDEVLARLQARVKGAEREAREVQKRYAEQERSFDAERAALQKQERHLQTRIRTLQAPVTTTSSQNHANTRHLEEELDSLRLSHSTLLAQLDTLTKELDEARRDNARLVEENEGWEFLVRDRTFNGQVRSTSGLLGHSRQRIPSGNLDDNPMSAKSGLDPLDEDMEAEMEELHSDLEAHGLFEEHDDLQPGFHTSPESAHLAPPTRERRRRHRRKGETSPDAGGGLDLATELGRASDLDGPEMTVSIGGDESEALRAEVKQLREANKALNLYCSKILDRIIAQEGFEHVLSVDYKTRRMGTRAAPGAARGNLKDITNAMKENQSSTPETARPEKKARPLSMMVRAMAGVGAGQGDSMVVEEPKVAEKKDDQKSEKRARRGFSLDFRSLGFGSLTPLPADPEPAPTVVPGLKPLTLSSRSSPVITPKPTAPRKLEPHAEDEEDRRERSRLEATFKLMGIDRASPSPSEGSPKSVHDSPVPSSRYWASKGRTNSPTTSDSSDRGVTAHSNQVSIPDPRRGGTPLSRLSEALGMGSSPLSAPAIEEVMDPVTHAPSPERVAAALKAYDWRQAEQAKALAKGTQKSEYTSPPSSTIRRAGLHRRNSSAEGDLKIGATGVPKSESRSTLWSLGEGGLSRPTSGEFVQHKTG